MFHKKNFFITLFPCIIQILFCQSSTIICPFSVMLKHKCHPTWEIIDWGVSGKSWEQEFPRMTEGPLFKDMYGLFRQLHSVKTASVCQHSWRLSGRILRLLYTFITDEHAQDSFRLSRLQLSASQSGSRSCDNEVLNHYDIVFFTTERAISNCLGVAVP